jgi:hypothetical protein
VTAAPAAPEPSGRIDDPPPDGARIVVQAWLGSRLLLLAAALVSAWLSGRTAAQLISGWDVQHFLLIAREGYVRPPEVAFFPGLPLLLRGAGALGVPMEAAGVVLSLVGSGFAAAALHRLGGPRAGVMAAAAWLLAPTAVFTVVPYTESLFCAFAFWAWVRAREDRWAWVGILAAGACAFRVSGVFLIVALATLALTERGPSLRSRLPWLGLPAVVLAAYATYLRVTQGSWTAWYDAQAAGWSRTFTWPWDSIRNTIPAIVPGAYPDHPGWAIVFRFEVVSLVVGIVVTVICLVRRRWADAVWVGIQVLAFSTSYWLMSVNRAVLLWFPLWLLIGEVTTAGRTVRARRLRTVLGAAWLALSAALLVWWAQTFFQGGWAS